MNDKERTSILPTILVAILALFGLATIPQGQGKRPEGTEASAKASFESAEHKSEVKGPNHLGPLNTLKDSWQNCGPYAGPPGNPSPIVFGTKFAADIGMIFALCLHAYPETAGIAGRQRWRDDVDEICNQVTSRVWSTSTLLHPYWRGSRTSAPSATVRATASCSSTSTSVSSCSTSSVPRSPACAPFSRRRPLRLSSDDWGFGLHRWVRLARPHGCLTPAPCTKSCKNWPVRPRRLSTGRMLNSCSISQPWTAVSLRLLTDLHQTITRLDGVLVWLEVAPCRV